MRRRRRGRREEAASAGLEGDSEPTGAGALGLPGCERSRGRFKPEAPTTAGAGAPPADGFFEDASDASDKGWSAWDDSVR